MKNSEEVKKSECGLSCCLVLSAAWKRRERKTGQVCPAWKACVEEGERMLPSPFNSYPGKWPGQNGMKYSHWSKIWVRDQNSQNIPAPDNNLKFFLLHICFTSHFCFQGIVVLLLFMLTVLFLVTIISLFGKSMNPIILPPAMGK